MSDPRHYVITFNTAADMNPVPLSDWLHTKARSLNLVLEYSGLDRRDGNGDRHAMLVIEDLTGNWTEARISRELERVLVRLDPRWAGTLVHAVRFPQEGVEMPADGR